MSTRSNRPATASGALPDITSAGGEVAYRVFETATGIVVQRSVRQGGSGRVDCFVRFANEEVFLACAEMEARYLNEPGLARRLTDLFPKALSSRRASRVGGRAETYSIGDRSSEVMGVAQRIATAVRQADVVELMHTGARMLGATASVYVSVIPEPGSSPSLRVLFDGDAAAFHDGVIGGSGSGDPWLAYALALAEPTVISGDTDEGSPPRLGLLALAEFQRTLVVSTPAAELGQQRFGAMGFGLQKANLMPTEEQAVSMVLARALAEQISGWWYRASRTEFMQQARLSAADLRLLALIREGAKVSEAATMLGSTTATSSRRLRSIVKRLGTVDLDGAIQRSVEYGW